MSKQLTFDDERSDVQKRLEQLEGNRHPIALLLDEVQDIRNIGAIFRLADAAAVQHIYLYRISQEEISSKKLKRVARSTHQFIPYSFINKDNLQDIVGSYEWIALEVTDDSIPYTDFKPIKPVLLIIGNEKSGVSVELLQKVKASIHIPMYGVNTSMNVACATAIALFELVKAE